MAENLFSPIIYNLIKTNKPTMKTTKIITIQGHQCLIWSKSKYIAFSLDGEYFFSKYKRGQILNDWYQLHKMKSGSSRYYCVSTPIGKQYCHRIICQTVHKQPKGCNTVNHKDLNVFNNSINNLEWTSHKENARHSFKLKRKYLINNVTYNTLREIIKTCNIRIDHLKERLFSEQFKNYQIIYEKK